MTLRVEALPDGTLHYISDGPVVLTGPVEGEVTMPDGSTVDVTPAVVEVGSEDEGMRLAEAIAAKRTEMI